MVTVIIMPRLMACAAADFAAASLFFFTHTPCYHGSGFILSAMAAEYKMVNTDSVYR